jgi:putative endonuclease
MEKNSQKTGAWAEEQAVLLLKKKNLIIHERNWRFKKYEIDIIAQEGKSMVFVEVKARTSDVFGEPELFVSKGQQKRLITAAHHYINEKNIVLESRFDIISILIINNNVIVKHLEDAFYPSLS